SGVGGGSAILQQLLRHGTQTGGGDKGLPHAAHARRDGIAFFSCSDSVGAAGGGGLFGSWFGGCRVFGRRTLSRLAFRRRGLGWRALDRRGRLRLGNCGLQNTEPEQGENSRENYNCKTAHSNPT